jgi:hypothetical protein
VSNKTTLLSQVSNNFSGRNRIINGDMRIDQRNAGASITPSAVVYSVDRWTIALTVASKFAMQQNAGSVTPPTGFTNYLGMTSASAYSLGSTDYFAVQQAIEGLNVADLAWGTSSAKTVTLSFWAYSSLTGTFGGAVRNSANNRSCPFSYTISIANTWTYCTYTIPGDISGTWLTTNGVGIWLDFSLGAGTTYKGTAGVWSGSLLISCTGETSIVGTNGSTLYITGVQLEPGTTATGFEYIPFSTSLARCQRYYETNFPYGIAVQNAYAGSGPMLNGVAGLSTYATNLSIAPVIRFKVTKRTTPTMTAYSASTYSSSGTFGWYNGSAWGTISGGSFAGYNTEEFVYVGTTTGATAGYTWVWAGYWSASSEL